jgi:hypothetical protein
LVLFSKKNKRFFLKKEAKTFYPFGLVRHSCGWWQAAPWPLSSVQGG